MASGTVPTVYSAKPGSQFRSGREILVGRGRNMRVGAGSVEGTPIARGGSRPRFR